MVIIWICLAGLVSLGLYIENKSYRYGMAGFTLVIVAGLLLVSLLIMWPMFYFEYTAKIQEYYALQETIEIARKENINDFERTAIMLQVAEMNKEIRVAQYWQQTILSIYYPAELAELEMLK